MKKVLIAGLAGGVAVFVWGANSHMVLPLGTMGLKTLTNEDVVLSAMNQSIAEPGLYFFPGMDMSGNATEEEEAAWAAKYAAGPIGILVYQSRGVTSFPHGSY